MSAKHVDQVLRIDNLVSTVPIANKVHQIVKLISQKYPHFRPVYRPEWNSVIGDKELRQHLQKIGYYLVVMLNQNTSTTKKKFKPLPDMICHFCNKKGHKWRHCRFRQKDCPSWTPEKKSDDNAADWDGD